MTLNSARSTLNFVDSRHVEDPHFYSHAVSVNGAGRLIFTSGQLGSTKDGSLSPDFGEQVSQAFQNLEYVLKAAGGQVRDVIKLTFYCVNWTSDSGEPFIGPTFQFLTDKYGIKLRPLTTLVPVTHLAIPEAKFEVEAVAAIGGLETSWTNGSEAIEHHIQDVKVDVVVVGGGFSGLQAAYDVQKKGLSCVLLEAKNRIGGRSRSLRLASGDGTVDMGATWINKKTQPKIYALAQKYDLDCVPQYEEGHIVWELADGSISRVKQGEIPENKDLEKLLAQIDSEASTVDINNSDCFPASQDMTVEDWLSHNHYDGLAAEFFRHFVRALVGREAREVGLHYILDYIKSGGGFLSLASEGPDGAQSLKIRQGTSAIAAGLASEMAPDSVVLNSPVDAIEQYGATCKVKTRSGTTIECKKAIIAIPTNVYEKIKFSPPLPYKKRAIVSRTKPGVYAKYVLTYKQPWWKALGLTGSFQSFAGPICFSWETSDEATKQYSLALFIAGDIAGSWHQLSELRRQESVIDHLARLIGPDNSHLALDVLEANCVEWTKEEFIEGAPTSAMGSGELSRFGKALREPYVDLHFAGGETAFEWKGYLEGALLAGSRAASEVVALLQSTGKEDEDLKEAH